MTNEQAAIKLQNILNDDHYAWTPAHAEALRMAVEALKLVNETGGLVNGLVNEDCTSKMVAQPEPCEDAVSRAKVMNRIDRIIEVNKLNPSLVWFTPNGVKALIAELPSAQPEQRWIPWDSGEFPEESGTYTVTAYDGATKRVTYAKYQKRLKRWELTGARAYWRVLAWMPLPEPYREDIE